MGQAMNKALEGWSIHRLGGAVYPVDQRYELAAPL